MASQNNWCSGLVTYCAYPIANLLKPGYFFAWKQGEEIHAQKVHSFVHANSCLPALQGYSGLQLLKVEEFSSFELETLAAEERKRTVERNKDEAEYERLKQKLGK